MALFLAAAALVTPFLLGARARGGASDRQAPARDAAIRYVPDDLQDTSWLKKLGAAQAVDGIEVQWPSGKKQVVQGPFKINSTIDLREQ